MTHTWKTCNELITKLLFEFESHRRFCFCVKCEEVTPLHERNVHQNNMSINHQEVTIEGIGQSPGCDPKASKRNSGLFSFLRWFRPSTSRESVDTDAQNSNSSSCDSLNSLHSNGTAASFSFVPPSAYKSPVTEKVIVLGPETDTYRARLKQREKRRENDKNLTLRKKYNLFFHREAALQQEDEDNTKSLPLMTRKTAESDEEKTHRRTASESSKIKKAGAYCHVKGKRKAPQPPVKKNQNTSTMSLKRKKRLAPAPPEKLKNSQEKFETIEYADADVIFNDSLKLDHGILKPAKEADVKNEQNSPNTSARSSYVEAPVSPRPWYKRNTSRESLNSSKKDNQKSDHKYEQIECLPEVQFKRNSTLDLTLMEEPKQDKKKEDKRKSTLSFLTNISELDREASEIIRKEHQKQEASEMPEFMRPKQDNSKINTDSWLSPRRRSARDLISKFNAITNVTKVTVNTAFFGSKESNGAQKENCKRDYFGKQASLNEEKRENENKYNTPLMKSESASAIKNKPETPKFNRKTWYCPKCSIENDYWRIICHVCSTIKPYFDDLTSPPIKNSPPEKVKLEQPEKKESSPKPVLTNNSPERILERSKTQIGFSALAKYNETKKSNDKSQRDIDREKLKKMLIEMKNSLPKRKSNVAVKNNRTSVIKENPETCANETKINTEQLTTKQDQPVQERHENENKKIVENKDSKTDESVAKTIQYILADQKPKFESKNQKAVVNQIQNTSKNVAEVIVVTKETIYENIKVKKTEIPKPLKVSSAAQTSAVLRKPISPKTRKVVAEASQNFELLRPKDFANIYSDKTGKPSSHVYANLAQNDDLSLFFNMPKRFSELKKDIGQASSSNNNTDTLEINRLLKRLENAIAKGEMVEASVFARELAQLKINCSVIRQRSVDNVPSTNEIKAETFTVEMYVEDKISHRGPFPIQVTQDETVAELKVQIKKEFEIPVNVQRWIIGKELASDDAATLKDLNVTTEGCPIFLYLVAPTNEVKTNHLENKPKQSSVTVSKEEVPSTSNAKTVAAKNEREVTAQDTSEPQGSQLVQNIAEPQSSGPVQSIPKPNGSRENQEIPKIAKEEEIKQKPEKDTPVDENMEEYDTKTLKPQTEWECRICTLLNPLTSRVCAACAVVRKNDLPQTIQKRSKKKTAPKPKINDHHYLQLVNLDNADLVENAEPFECIVCFLEVPPGEGVTLRECLHQFCKNCLAYTVEYTEEAEIKCPYRDEQYSCDIALQDREIKALVKPAIYDQYLARSVSQAENKIDKSFHCKTPDCKGWCIFEDNVNDFRCPVCRKVNCLTCQAIHMGLNCRQYQESMRNASFNDEDAKRTKDMLEEMVNKGEALVCPTCQVVLMKKWGCDWLRCSMCKTEICWVTRGPRWGPGGKGDTSGGCQCGVNGIKCHPQCNYCH